MQEREEKRLQKEKKRQEDLLTAMLKADLENLDAETSV